MFLPLLFSCGEGDTDNLQREITQEMLNNGYTGKGTFTYIGGGKYVGEWKDGICHGLGTSTFTNGRVYVGEFKNDKFHGQGTLTTEYGAVYKGLFENGEWLGEFKGF